MNTCTTCDAYLNSDGRCPDCAYREQVAEDWAARTVEDHERWLMTEGADHLFEGRGE